MVSVVRIRLDSHKSMRPFKGIICDDISEFESFMPSHAVWSPRANMQDMLYAQDSWSLLLVFQAMDAIANAISPNSTTINETAGPRAIFCLLLEALKSKGRREARPLRPFPLPLMSPTRKSY
jgi:hypothetical protein